MKHPCAASLSAALAFLAVASSQPARAADTPKTACARPEARQFDFWAGDWDVFDKGDLKTPTAHVVVSHILDGCALLEHYEDPKGEVGQSITAFDSSRGVWHQTWITNHGDMLIVEGTFKNGAMTLTGSERMGDGKPRMVRGTWKLIDGGVEEIGLRSTNGGKTWTLWFDLIFKPHEQVMARL